MTNMHKVVKARGLRVGMTLETGLRREQDQYTIIKVELKKWRDLAVILELRDHAGRIHSWRYGSCHDFHVLGGGCSG